MGLFGRLARLLALEAHPLAMRAAGAQRRGHHRDATERADGWVVVHRGSMSDAPTDERGDTWHGTGSRATR